MAKRPTRTQRFNDLKDFYGMLKAGHLTSEQVKDSLNYKGTMIFESEVDKFNTDFPDIDATDFLEFIKNAEVLRKPGRKNPVGTATTRLTSDEKAEQLGISAENKDEYVALITEINAKRKRLAELITTPLYSSSFSITKSKAKSA